MDMVHELSLFLDESGSDGLDATYYLLTVVMHDQADSLMEHIDSYERSLRQKGLGDIPFHASPLMNGHDAYEHMDIAVRKKLFSSFRVFFRHLPIKYWCIALKTKEYDTTDKIEQGMRRALVNLLFDELPSLQNYDMVKVYYNNGQHAVASAVHDAIEYALAKDAVNYRLANPQDYRLSQVADYICTAELTALKYADHATTATDEKFFGSWSMFKKGILKEVRRKRC